MDLEGRIKSELEQLRISNNLRSLKESVKSEKWIFTNNHKMLNLSSNDYLGLTSDHELQVQFSEQALDPKLGWTAASSRLLTGNHNVYTELEQQIAKDYLKEAALVFSSGYHTNTGILPALTTKEDIIIADKLVHASLIDGIKLSAATFARYRHNDMKHLEMLLKKYSDGKRTIFVVTESVFSMDGDCAPLKEIIALKKRYNFVLYLDEAHAVGAIGHHGLGLAEQEQVLSKVDILVGTFGKALASVGAYVVADRYICNWLINKMRTLIFTTALPPVNVAWTLHVWKKMLQMTMERKYLQMLSMRLRQALSNMGIETLGSTHIVPFMVNDASKSLALSLCLQKKGYHVLPIRKPTVAEGTERLRFSLRADMTSQEIDNLVASLKQCQ